MSEADIKMNLNSSQPLEKSRNIQPLTEIKWKGEPTIELTHILRSINENKKES